MEGVQKEMWLSCCVFMSRAIVKLQWDLCDYQTLAFSLTSWSLLTRGPSQCFTVVFNTINRDTSRKKITRKKWLYGMLFFFPNRSLGSMSCSHSYIRIVWLIPQCLSLPFPQTSHSWAVPETSTETQALPDGAASKQAQSFPSADLLPRQGVRWEGLHSWGEQLKKPTALSMHTQWNVYRTSLDLFPWYLHMPVLMINSACRLQFLLYHLLFISHATLTWFCFIVSRSSVSHDRAQSYNTWSTFTSSDFLEGGSVSAIDSRGISVK